jgi:hypothetical protein
MFRLLRKSNRAGEAPSARTAVGRPGDEFHSQHVACAGGIVSKCTAAACALLHMCSPVIAALHGGRTSLTGMSRAPWMPLAALGDPGAAAPSKNPAGSPAPLRASMLKSISLPASSDND